MLLFFFFRTERLARDICRDLCHGPLVALCCLKGGYQFFSHLSEFIINYNGTSGMFSWFQCVPTLSTFKAKIS